MIQIHGVEIPNQIDELTVEQFDKMFEIDNNEELDTLEKWMSKFAYLGADENSFNDMDLNDFVEYVKKFNETPLTIPERISEITVDKYVYKAPEKIGVKDFGMIEKVWRNQSPKRCLETMAILFKREDLTKSEHYAPAHLKQKAKLFANQKASVVVPYMTEVLTKLNNLTEKKLNETTEELDASNG